MCWPLHARLLSPNELLESFGGHGLGALKGEAEGAVPNERGGHTYEEKKYSMTLSTKKKM